MTEIERILALPSGDPPPLPVALEGIRPAQSLALREYVRALHTPASPLGERGCVVGLGCGHGKTLVGLLIPVVHKAVTGKDPRVLYLLPAPLVEQFHRDLADWATVYPIVVGGQFVMSHEQLSAPSGKHKLRDIAPDLVIIDEGHRYGVSESARWRRLRDFIVSSPKTRIVVMSGSLLWDSVLNARHLLVAALRDWAPVPLDSVIERWAAAIDVGSTPSQEDRRALEPLRAWAGSDDDRRAFHARLWTAPGVALTSDVATDRPLRCVFWRPSVTVPPEVAAAVAGLERGWTLPDGTELVSIADYTRAADTLAFGFYHRWKPPVDEHWLEVRQRWAGELRALVEYAPGVYQTPGDVLRFARAGKLDIRRQRLYDAWVEIEPYGPERETVWLDGAEDYVRRVVETWAAGDGLTADFGQGKPVVWVRNPELGMLVARVTGWAYHGAGSEPPSGWPAVCSIAVHGTGWNTAPAHGYTRSLVLQLPAGGRMWEQLLSRLHRDSHRSAAADEIVFTLFGGTRRSYSALNNAVAGARFARDTTGATQRLLLANWQGIAINRVSPGTPNEEEEE